MQSARCAGKATHDVLVFFFFFIIIIFFFSSFSCHFFLPLPLIDSKFSATSVAFLFICSRSSAWRAWLSAHTWRLSRLQLWKIVEDGKGRKGLARLLKNAKTTKFTRRRFLASTGNIPDILARRGHHKSTGAIWHDPNDFLRAEDYVDYLLGSLDLI